MSDRTVNCAKLGQEAPGLKEPPFEGELGQEIFENISQEAWNEWADEVMIRVINEYRLNLADEEHYKILLGHMRTFFNLK